MKTCIEDGAFGAERRPSEATLRLGAGHFLAAKGPSTRRSERLARLGRPNPPVDEQVTHELAALRNRISPSMS